MNYYLKKKTIIRNMKGRCSMIIEETVKKVNEILKNNEDYKDDKAMQVQYILLDKDKQISDIICYGWDGMVSIDSKTFEIEPISDWAYSSDTHIFEPLKDGETIGYMTAEAHYNIWCNIAEWYPEDINCKEGLDLYIKYCDENGITKEYLDKMNKLDTPDIMDNFSDLDVGDTLEYKGFIACVDEPNVDNEKENIIYIYKSKQDFINGEYIEGISLNKEGIKKNIKEYIDETYSPETSKNPNYESEKAYFTFVLGYDLLQDMFKNSTVQECDRVYDFCNYEAEQFLESNEYHNLKYSGYEMLVEWIEKNKETIRADYKEMTGGEPEIYNGNMVILEKGFRKDQPVALVEKTLNDNEKEYIVAMYYKVNDDKLSWGYAYYYDNDKSKAQEDYKNVISGGNLAHTFDKGQER